MLPTNIPKPEALAVITRFKGMDKDNSGTLTVDELVAILMELLGGKMAESNVRRLASMQFQAADKDKSGTLNVEEFLQVWAFIREQV
jgi:Ca2+-binding EF-hand superfamily protein